MESPVLTARPIRLRIVCWICAVAVVALFALIATALTGRTDSGLGAFGRGDQIAMVLLGVVIGLGVLGFTRPRLWADDHGVRIRNVFGSYDLPWQVVRSVRFDDGSPWASLDLADDDSVAVMAIQRADHDSAVTAVRELRSMLASHRHAD